MGDEFNAFMTGKCMAYFTAHYGQEKENAPLVNRRTRSIYHRPITANTDDDFSVKWYHCTDIVYKRVSQRMLDIMIQRGINDKFHDFHIKNEDRIAMTWRWLCGGGSVISVALPMCIPEGSMYDILHSTIEIFYHALKGEMVWPDSPEKWLMNEAGYLRRWNIPICFAIDGKCVRQQAPPHSGYSYWCYKQFSAITILAVCNANYEFQFGTAHTAGSLGDRYAYNVSKLRDLIENSTTFPPDRTLPGDDGGTLCPRVGAGDSAFPLNGRLVIGYQTTVAIKELTGSQSVFNYRLSRGRMTIESSFGILAAKMQCLRYGLRFSVPHNVMVCEVAMMLHNTLIREDRTTYLQGINIDAEGRVKFDRRYGHLADMPVLKPGNADEPQMNNDDRLTDMERGELAREQLHDWVHGAGWEAWQIPRVQRGK